MMFRAGPFSDRFEIRIMNNDIENKYKFKMLDTESNSKFILTCV
jgi:hypothetical protein